MHAEQIDKDGPVTVVVTRTAKRDKIREFEEWMDGIKTVKCYRLSQLLFYLYIEKAHEDSNSRLK
jgi:hypothetical protein